MEVVWRIKASNELMEIYNYIYKESPQNALLVFNAIFDLATSLSNFPYKFPKEPIINVDKVRFYVVWDYKIIYAIEGESIVILRVFNTKQNPRKLKK